MKAAQWIDALKKARGWSDRRVAEELGIRRRTIIKHRLFRTTLDDLSSIKVGELLGIDPVGLVLVDQIRERSRHPEVRESMTHALAILTNQEGEYLLERGQREANQVTLGPLPARSGSCSR